MEQWLNIYRDYTLAELDAEIASLRKQASNPYNSQTEGERSYSRSTAETRDRLEAAQQAKREKTGRAVVREGTADFSGGIGGY